MLVPKRVKHRREFRGKMRGEAKGGKTIAFGEYGLEAVESHWITNRQIEAARIAMTRFMKRGGRVWIRIFPQKSWKETPSQSHHPCDVRRQPYCILIPEPPH